MKCDRNHRALHRCLFSTHSFVLCSQLVFSVSKYMYDTHWRRGNLAHAMRTRSHFSPSLASFSLCDVCICAFAVRVLCTTSLSCHLAFATQKPFLLIMYNITKPYIESTDLRVVVMLEHAAFSKLMNENCSIVCENYYRIYRIATRQNHSTTTTTTSMMTMNIANSIA